MKSTKVEIDRRVYEISKMIIAGISNPDIVQHCTEKYRVNGRQIYEYIERARKLIVESNKEDIELETSKSQRRYNELYAKAIKTNNLNVALGSVKAMCELRGLNRPQKTALTDPTGENEAQGVIILPPLDDSNGDGGNGSENQD